MSRAPNEMVVSRLDAATMTWTTPAPITSNRNIHIQNTRVDVSHGIVTITAEAIILSVIGGIIGLNMVWIISIIITNVLDFEFVLSTGNIILGTVLAAIIGLISGILPAISASRLDPVEAIRTGM